MRVLFAALAFVSLNAHAEQIAWNQLPANIAAWNASNPYCSQQTNEQIELLPESFEVDLSSEYSPNYIVTVYLVPCGVYAYQTDTQVYLVDPYGDTSQLSFVSFDGGAFGAQSAAMGLRFDPTTRHFETFYKSRGIADCGSSSVHYLNEFGTVNLKEFREQGCDPGETDWSLWPVTYSNPQLP